VDQRALTGLGACAGLLLAYGATIVWNPDSYERALPLLLIGAVAGGLAGAWIARRR
jgi:hypothetical protein